MTYWSRDQAISKPIFIHLYFLSVFSEETYFKCVYFHKMCWFALLRYIHLSSLALFTNTFWVKLCLVLLAPPTGHQILQPTAFCTMHSIFCVYWLPFFTVQYVKLYAVYAMINLFKKCYNTVTISSQHCIINSASCIHVLNKYL